MRVRQVSDIGDSTLPSWLSVTVARSAESRRSGQCQWTVDIEGVAGTDQTGQVYHMNVTVNGVSFSSQDIFTISVIPGEALQLLVVQKVTLAC